MLRACGFPGLVHLIKVMTKQRWTLQSVDKFTRVHFVSGRFLQYWAAEGHTDSFTLPLSWDFLGRPQVRRSWKSLGTRGGSGTGLHVEHVEGAWHSHTNITQTRLSKTSLDIKVLSAILKNLWYLDLYHLIVVSRVTVYLELYLGTSTLPVQTCPD